MIKNYRHVDGFIDGTHFVQLNTETGMLQNFTKYGTKGEPYPLEWLLHLIPDLLSENRWVEIDSI